MAMDLQASMRDNLLRVHEPTSIRVPRLVSTETNTRKPPSPVIAKNRQAVMANSTAPPVASTQAVVAVDAVATPSRKSSAAAALAAATRTSSSPPLARQGDAAEDKRPGSGDSVRDGRRSSSASRVGKSIVGEVTTTRTTPRTAQKAANRKGNSHLPKDAAAVSIAPQPDHLPELLKVDRAAQEKNRAALVAGLERIDFCDPGADPMAFHGRIFDGSAMPEQPAVKWSSNKKPRQNSPDWLTATEYADTPKVFQHKVQCLAKMLLASRRTLAYTGAGLSVAAGIGMAAVGSNAQGGMGVATAGEPTLSHCVLAELNRQNLLHGWVQQNHDGLPQKAGYRQEDINEIHGSWFDPSNPVVKYSGSLRNDFFTDMETQAETADLVLVLGTSLTGLNADQCVRKTADRSRKGKSLGSVIISPQRTAQDGRCSLRIFAKADEVMRALTKALFKSEPRAVLARAGKRSANFFPKEDKILVPYDANGNLSTTVRTYWDLSRGAKVHIGSNNNIQGAKQPCDAKITENTVGTVMGRDENTCSFRISFGSTTKQLGLWWIETAMRGRVATLPVVNVDVKEMKA